MYICSQQKQKNKIMINLGDVTIELEGRDFHFMDVKVLEYKSNGEDIDFLQFIVLDVDVESVWMGETTKTTLTNDLKSDLMEYLSEDEATQIKINNYNEL